MLKDTSVTSKVLATINKQVLNICVVFIDVATEATFFKKIFLYSILLYTKVLLYMYIQKYFCLKQRCMVVCPFANTSYSTGKRNPDLSRFINT